MIPEGGEAGGPMFSDEEDEDDLPTLQEFYLFCIVRDIGIVGIYIVHSDHSPPPLFIDSIFSPRQIRLRRANFFLSL